MGLLQILELLDRAMASERQFIAEFVRADELWKAAQAQARWQALAAFKEVLLARKAGPEDPDP